MLSGFTFVRNAIQLDYPIVPAIRSLLEVCDEVVVNVGASEDETRDLVASIGDPRLRIIDSVWDFSRGSDVLAAQTGRAMAACRGRWGLYIQADEVLHETGARELAEGVQEWDADERVEGILVNYLHFYGGFDMIATNRHWYRREVRCIRLGRDVRSYEDAQGFRVGPELRRIRARRSAAEMFHYGWARPSAALRQKRDASGAIYPESRSRLERRPRREGLDWTPLLRRFTGTHPRAALEWIAARRLGGEAVGPPQFRLEHLRLYLSDWIERLTGTRLFEYRNYVEA